MKYRKITNKIAQGFQKKDLNNDKKIKENPKGIAEEMPK